MTDDGPRWAGRVILAVYVLAFLSAVWILIRLVGQKVVAWVREKGGW
jgi:hypothetical protein